MAHGAVAKRDIVAVGNQCVIALTDGKRNEVVGFALQRGCDTGRDCGDHPLKIEGVDRNFSRRGVADSVRRLRNGGEPNDFSGTARDGRSCLSHYNIHSTHWPDKDFARSRGTGMDYFCLYIPELKY